MRSLGISLIILLGLSIQAAAAQEKPNEPLETGFERKLGVVYKTVGKRELAFDLYYPKAETAKPFPTIIYREGSPPLFLIQGDKDTTIPVKHAFKMAERAKDISAPVKTLIVKNAGHNWRKVDAEITPSRNDILQATVAFFVDHANLSPRD